MGNRGDSAGLTGRMSDHRRTIAVTRSVVGLLGVPWADQQLGRAADTPQNGSSISPEVGLGKATASSGFHETGLNARRCT